MQIESLCYLPESNRILCVSYASIKKKDTKKGGKLEWWFHGRKNANCQ